jgi:hypothetical protein
MEEYDEFGIKDDPAPTDFNIASWVAMGRERENDLRYWRLQLRELAEEKEHVRILNAV